MINILPPEEKKKIIAEYRLRLGIVVIFAIAALVLSGLVLLAPSYLLAVSKYNSVSGELVALQSKQGRGAQEKDVTTQIGGLNKKIDLFLKGGTSTSSPSQVILSILNLKGGAIKIQGFTYDASTGQGRMVITGTALDRVSLAQFVKTLKKEPTFTSVELPISSYVKSVDIDFSIVVDRGIKK